MISIQVVDKTQRIKPALTNVEADVFFSSDEIHAISAIEQMQPSVVMLNYDFFKDQTIEYITLILQVSAKSKVIVVVDEVSQRIKINCLIAGAQGYQDIKNLDLYAKKLVHVVDAGEAWVSRRLLALILDSFCVKYINE